MSLHTVSWPRPEENRRTMRKKLDRLKYFRYIYVWLIEQLRNQERLMPRKKKFEGGRMIHIRIPEDVHRLLRMRVAEDDTCMQDWVADLIEKTLKKRKAK
jgi:hypothetical protein